MEEETKQPEEFVAEVAEEDEQVAEEISETAEIPKEAE